MSKPRVIPRHKAKHCHWCGVELCHKCRQADETRVAICGGWWGKLCDRASTRDHLIPRTVKKSRREHSGYKNPPPNVVACRGCNTRRGAMPVDEWLSVLANIGEDGL